MSAVRESLKPSVIQMSVETSFWRLALKRVSPIVCLNESETGVPLYCIHPVSGDVVGLRGLAARLGNQPFFGIQVPKEKMNAAFGASIEAIARQYVELLEEFQPNGAINLAGWSAGAVIALEMAHQFRARGRQVPLLVALDGAPCNSGAELRSTHPRYLLKLALNLPRWIRDDRQQDWSVRGIAKRVRSKLTFRFGIGAPKLADVGTIDAETMLQVLDADGWSTGQKAFIHAIYKAMIAYVPKAYDGPVVVYETQTQPLYHLRQVGTVWARLAPGAEIVHLKGNHSGLLAEPTVDVIGRHLAARLDGLDAG